MKQHIFMVLAVLMLAVAGARADGPQLQAANRCDNTPIRTNNWVATTNASQVFDIELSNFSGADVYLLIFDSATNKLAGAVPDRAPILVPNNTTGSKSWGPSGSPFAYGVNVCASTTPHSLTNASLLHFATVNRRQDR
jgi:hypothetical protein